MKTQKESLIESIKLYLRKNDLDGDSTHFYTIKEWKEKGEEYLIDSEFVIVDESGLYHMLNYGDSDEFYDLVESFGYFMEMGHSWSYGFYSDEDFPTTSKNRDISYSEKLQDKKWQLKRNKIIEKANYKCQDCGSTARLEVHHCYYKYGLEPWQYPFDSLRCLCEKCHKRRGKIEIEIRARMAGLKTDELQIISKLIYGGMEYYPESKIIEFIESLGLKSEMLKTKIDESEKGR